MSCFAGKSKGKGKGKASGAKGGAYTPGGHTLPRTRLSAEKFTGEVAAWKGKYGWIKAAEEIEHEKAKLHNGSLFASIDDIEGGNGLEAGTPVEFHIWEDESGLGAEEIVATGKSKTPGKGAKGLTKGASKGKDSWGSSWGGKDSWGKSAGKASSWTSPWGGKADSWGGKGSWAAPAKGAVWAPSKGVTKGAWSAGGVINSWGKSAGIKGGKDGKGKGKDGKAGREGHKLPRTRISAEKFTGTVAVWKGKYGFITPAEEISHEKAKLHGGGLFVSLDNLEGGLTELTKGSTVEFHIWEDSSGLGAEEVVQY